MLLEQTGRQVQNPSRYDAAGMDLTETTYQISGIDTQNEIIDLDYYQIINSPFNHGLHDLFETTSKIANFPGKIIENLGSLILGTRIEDRDPKIQYHITYIPNNSISEKTGYWAGVAGGLGCGFGCALGIVPVVVGVVIFKGGTKVFNVISYPFSSSTAPSQKQLVIANAKMDEHKKTLKKSVQKAEGLKKKFNDTYQITKTTENCAGKLSVKSQQVDNDLTQLQEHINSQKEHNDSFENENKIKESFDIVIAHYEHETNKLISTIQTLDIELVKSNNNVSVAVNKIKERDDLLKERNREIEELKKLNCNTTPS